MTRQERVRADRYTARSMLMIAFFLVTISSLDPIKDANERVIRHVDFWSQYPSNLGKILLPFWAWAVCKKKVSVINICCRNLPELDVADTSETHGTLNRYSMGGLVSDRYAVSPP